MKFALFIALLPPLTLLSVAASAGTPDISTSSLAGKTTCTKVSSLDRKLSTDTPCSYKAVMGSSSVYAIRHIDFDLPNGDKVRTVDDLQFSANAKGDLQYKGAKTTIDNQPARVLNLNAKTFDQILSSRLDSLRALDDPDYSKILRCFKPIDSPTAFCVPYNLLLDAK